MGIKFSFGKKHPDCDRELQSDFEKIIEKGLSRRDFIKQTSVIGMASFASASTLGGALAATQDVNTNLMGFRPVPANSLDTVTVPEGYSYNILVSWGDPIMPGGVSFDNATRGTAQSQALAFGDNNDGMELYHLAENRAILAVNNEYTDIQRIMPGGEAVTIDDINKGRLAHGVSIIEIERDGNRGWRLVRDSQYNRRITPDTEMEITGIARGSDLLKTSYDPSAAMARGTWSNCGAGRTPWGTYLTCEENFDGYFPKTKELDNLPDEYKRYGVGEKDWGHNWQKEDKRFDINAEPNEPNRAGYVVEIDPAEPNSTPRKLTSLGRFKHENAECIVNADGRIVVYMGDDERGEYLYKFVSNRRYDPARGKANSELFEQGTLYVAKFHESDGRLSGRGEWIALVHGRNGLTRANGFEDQAHIQVFARNAATFVKATTMDRPEWVAAHPHNSSVYVALTNNKNRGKKKNRGGIEQVVSGPNPRAENNYGQILRWIPDEDDHAGTEFSWNLFVVAGNPLVKEGLYKGTANINPDNMFNSPDGIKFDNHGRLWIQTAGEFSNEGDYEGMGNNQMLCADPLTGEIKRFLVGPVGCEVTGATFSEKGTEMFIGIQHPGEDNTASTFPYGESVPRSSVVVIYKDDGGVVGT